MSTTWRTALLTGLTTLTVAMLLAAPTAAQAACVGGSPNGTLQAGEECDDNAQTAICDNDCTFVVCGDGHKNAAAGEQCDDGNANNNDKCLNTCQNATCHDGVLCSEPNCISGPTGGVEQCDDGNLSDTDACVGTCSNAACGDGFVQAGVEGCDDGNGVNNDACPSGVGGTCQPNVCGDGFKWVGGGQTCDDGNANDNDACPSNCKTATCGDGFTWNTAGGTETCDDGNLVDTDACTNACLVAACGDGIVQAGVEGCDDGDGINTDNCPDGVGGTCQPANCGDGFKWTAGGELCDDGNVDNSDTCVITNPGGAFNGALDGTGNCVPNNCGDGIKNGAEACDDGNLVDLDACTNSCTITSCGDGVLQLLNGEECDAGQATCSSANALNGTPCSTTAQCDSRVCIAPSPSLGAPCTAANAAAVCGNAAWCPQTGVCGGGGNRDDVANACRGDCQLPECGDGVIDSGAPFLESCDDSGESATCNDDCTIAVCGDGKVNVTKGETCDDAGNSATCDNDCTAAVCGDGKKNTVAGEQCDDGNTVATDACTDTCKTAICGDGITRTGVEECDNGLANDDEAACLSTCVLAECGDGFIHAGVEGCDDGDGINTDNCPDGVGGTCQPANCGDGFKWGGGGEVCDDGNAVNTDACIITSPGGPVGPLNCAAASCGDGFTQTGVEGCDDGNLIDTDACKTTCVPSTCGDGVTDALNGEECDNGQAFCLTGELTGLPCATAADCKVSRCTGAISTGALCQPGIDAVAICGSEADCTTTGTCDGAGVNRSDLANHCRGNCLSPACGDNVKDAGEACDDGNENNNDKCIINDFGGAPDPTPGTGNCVAAACHDGWTCSATTCTSGPGAGPEECDDGNTDDDDSCVGTCETAACGDGFVCTDASCTTGPTGGAEFCDLGGGNSDVAVGGPWVPPIPDPAVCRTICAPAFCGDGVTDYGEYCDDGLASGNADSCIITDPFAPGSGFMIPGQLPNCQIAACGDGFVCSDGSMTCTTGPTGGDEACDDANTLDGDGCNSSCKFELCGDGIVDVAAGETCDGDGLGTGGETATCDIDCSVADCGDGTVNVTKGEECDDGNTVSDDGCDIACIIEFCGDNTTQPGIGEECDPPIAMPGPDDCRPGCIAPACGDGIIDPGNSETCDDSGETATCDDDCTAPSCGDGNVNQSAGEECDDGIDNADTADACRATVGGGCVNPAHGDGIKDSDETCDEGPLGDESCTPDACSTGALPDSYNDGFDGAGCQYGTLVGTCEYGLCIKAKTIGKRLDKMASRIDQASGYAQGIGADLRKAERKVRSARRLAQKTAEKLAKLCPNDVAVNGCLNTQFDRLVNILVELEGNLAANNP